MRVTIHRWMNSGRNFKFTGEIGCIHVYNRDLTPSELLQNFNVIELDLEYNCGRNWRRKNKRYENFRSNIKIT